MKTSLGGRALAAAATVLPIVGLWSCVAVGGKFVMTPDKQITIGQSRKDDVRAMFGNPFVEIDSATWTKKRAHFGDEDTAMIWRYLYGQGTVGSASARFLQVEFDKNGTVSDYYFESSFPEDRTPAVVGSRNFDFFAARDLPVGKATKADVEQKFGKAYRVILIRKPNTAERWHYGYTEKVYQTLRGKNVDFDFDANGTIVAVRGESDFPDDKEKFYGKKGEE